MKTSSKAKKTRACWPENSLHGIVSASTTSYVHSLDSKVVMGRASEF